MSTPRQGARRRYELRVLETRAVTSIVGQSTERRDVRLEKKLKSHLNARGLPYSILTLGPKVGIVTTIARTKGYREAPVLGMEALR